MVAFFDLTPRAVTAYYDDSCGFCGWFVHRMRTLDTEGKITFVGASDQAAHRHSLSDDELSRSMVVIDAATGEKFVRGAAVARLIRALPAPFHLFRAIELPGIIFLTNAGYDIVARNRQRISRILGMNACMLPQRPEARSQERAP